MSHDSSFKLLFSHPRMVEDLLRGYVDEQWVQALDFSTLEHMEGSYVSDRLRKREQDMVWRLRWVGQERWVYVYLLLEFQSSSDRSMALRLLTYLCLLYQDLLRSKKLGRNDKLPPVLPLVLYNGEHRWTAPLDLDELIDTIPGSLEQYRPCFRHLLVNENDYANAGVPEKRNLVTALFALEQSRGPDQLRQVLEAVIELVAAPEHASLRRGLSTWMRSVLLPAKFPGVNLEAVNELSEVRDMLAQRVKNWTEEWKLQGMQEGIQKGMLQSHRDLLLRLVARRFGTSVAEHTGETLSAVSDLGTLETLAEHILDSPDATDWQARVAELLARPH